MLKNITSHKTQFHKQPNLTHLQILGSTVYILLYKKKYTMMSEKWVPQAWTRIVVGYNRSTIYRFYIKK